MRKIALTLFGMATLLAWAVAPARSRPIAQDQDRPAADAAQDRDRDNVRPELANFDVFLDGHPEIAKQLQSDPNLVNDPQYLDNHPELRDYLRDHPNVREDLKENPRAFMNGEKRFDREQDRRDSDIRRDEVASFDRFLDNHPRIDQELSKDPSLVDNPDYLAKHPELQQYLRDHPQVQDALKDNPRAFMNAEHRWDQRGQGAPPPRVEPVPDKH